MRLYTIRTVLRTGIIFVSILVLSSLSSAFSKSAPFSFPVNLINEAKGSENLLTIPEFPASISKPSGFTIDLPWGHGESHMISNGYKTGIHYPANCQSPESANTKDCYALNFGGSFSVKAIASGTVRYAGWASGGFGRYGRIVYICHGTFNTSVGPKEICSFYAHLGLIDWDITAGQTVSQGQFLGISGRNGCLTDSYWSDPHLHFSLHAGSSFQFDNNDPPSGCGSQGGIGPHSGYAVIPEPIDNCLKNGASSCEDFREDDVLQHQPDTVTIAVRRVWTEDWHGFTKTTFRPWDTIQYLAEINNSGSTNVSAHFVWQVTGPQPLFFWEGNLNLPSGTRRWYVPTILPRDAPMGTYSFWVSSDYSGQISSQATAFTDVLPTRVGMVLVQ